MTAEIVLESSVEPGRRVQERIILVGVIAGALIAVLGIGTSLVRGTGVVGIPVACVGLFGLILAIQLAHPLRTLRTIGLRSPASTEDERAKRWAHLKTTCVTLNLMTIVSAAFLLLSLLARVGLFWVPVAGALGHALAFVSLALVLNFAYAFILSLGLSLPRSDRPWRGFALEALLVFTLFCSALAVLADGRRLTIPGLFDIQSGDAPFLLLAATTSACAALFVSRSLPTIRALFTDESPDGPTYESRNRSLVLPSLTALSLLFLVLVLAGASELGVERFQETVRTNTFIAGATIIASVALAVSVWASLTVARHEDQMTLYRVSWSLATRREVLLLSASGIIVLLVLVPTAYLALGNTFFGLGPEYWIDGACIAVLAAIGPYGFYYAAERRRVRRLEERFPDFLRDLAASRRAGLTLANSVTIAANGVYGELSPEIQKMADQLTLNVSFEEALERFAERVNTPLVRRDVALIREAAHAGGQITDVLEAAAADAREVKNLEAERRSTMGMYTVVVYIIFLVFLVVIGILYASFIPPFLKASAAGLRAGPTGGIQFASVGASDFRQFYFLAALVQAIGNGLIAGIIESGRALAGLRHGFLMVAITYLAFRFFLP